MDKKSIMGTISFIHHDKKYVTIEYLANEKKKTINGTVSEKKQLQQTDKPKAKHSFRIGDSVSFEIILSEKGDRMIASNIQFRYNNALSNMLIKAAYENKFTGYLKKAGDQYFVKDAGSYILFPLSISPWESMPHESRINEPVFFKLNNIDKPEKVSASFFKSEYIPAYLLAAKYYKNKTEVEAVASKISPYGIFVDLFDHTIKAKIPVPDSSIKAGDKVKVMITFLSPQKIVLEQVK